MNDYKPTGLYSGYHLSDTTIGELLKNNPDYLELRERIVNFEAPELEGEEL